MSAYFFATAAKSAVGLVRSGNEDSAMTSRSLVAVADGMGGHAAGEVASRIAIAAMAKASEIFTSKDVDTDSADDLFSSTLTLIDSTISEYALENPALALPQKARVQQGRGNPRGLARAGRAHERDGGTRGNIQINTAQHLDSTIAGAQAFDVEQIAHAASCCVLRKRAAVPWPR